MLETRLAGDQSRVVSLFTEHGKPVPYPNGQIPRVPSCAWCGHGTRRELRPAYTSWGVLIIECVDGDACDTRFVFPGFS